MYKFIGLTMMGIFALMVFPASSIDATDIQSDEFNMWGKATIEQKDADGNILFTQTVHNQVVDTGETLLINQGFHDTVLNTDDTELVGSICVTKEASFSVTEGLTASTFDTNDALTSNNCKQDTAVDTTTTQGEAVIGPLTFNTGNLDAAGDTITGIGICQTVAADDNDFNQCATGNAGSGVLFAAVDVTDTTLGSGETVDITYTFDLKSASS